MKKLMTFALCAAAVGSLSAQKVAVDQAAKMSGKLDKLTEARELINQASKDAETMNDVRTYYIGGKIEFDAFENSLAKRRINPNDESVNLIDMGNELVNGYNMFLKALPLDSVPDEKGKIKAKNSKDMVGKMNAHHGDYFNYGGEMFNSKHYYPEAYNSFMIYGDMTKQPWADKAVKATADSVVALAYHYAGIGAYSGNALDAALTAFAKAREAGIKDPQNFVYEIASWQAIAQRDSTREEEAKNAIENVARAGYEAFGIKNPLFITNLVNTLIQNKKLDEAIALVSAQIDKTPDQPMLYGLRAYVYDRNKNVDASIADYKKAASYPNADVETLVNAAKRLCQTGQIKLNELEPGNGAKKKEIREEYLVPAMQISERVLEMDEGNPGATYVLDNAKYLLGIQ